MVHAEPAAHPEAFAWVVVVSPALYGNFALFREQLCVVLCPYGRLQSALLDEHSLVVGYDAGRGEPRGKKKAEGAGDCVDCKRCVVVCPTGIDIRNGLQIECIACTACIDACDDVMARWGGREGWSATTRRAGSREGRAEFIRPRVLLYTGLLVAGAVASIIALRARTDFEAHVARLPGAPFTNRRRRDSQRLRGPRRQQDVATEPGFDLRVDAPTGTTTVLSMKHVELDPLAQGHVLFHHGAAGSSPHERSGSRRRHALEHHTRRHRVRRPLARSRAMSFLAAAFLLGLLGSAHCVVMCGGVACALSGGLVQLGKASRAVAAGPCRRARRSPAARLQRRTHRGLRAARCARRRGRPSRRCNPVPRKRAHRASSRVRPPARGRRFVRQRSVDASRASSASAHQSGDASSRPPRRSSRRHTRRRSSRSARFGVSCLVGWSTRVSVALASGRAIDGALVMLAFGSAPRPR